MVSTGFFVWVFLFGLWGCKSRVPVDSQPPKPVLKPPLKAVPRPIQRICFTIQVGAFRYQSNAVRLTRKLHQAGIDAYHFIDPSGLYKVRFGDYSTRDGARAAAESIYQEGMIDDFYIVSPETYPEGKKYRYEEESVRDSLVKTARRFIGVPYRWGGTSESEGFDCSGLAMVVYRLNGFFLPRSSENQWVSGTQVSRDRLLKGDLVFFATKSGRKTTHVGIYTGNGLFIHAPGEGKTIRTSSLSNVYFSNRFMGGRRYL
jgi:hypothetical protein